MEENITNNPNRGNNSGTVALIMGILSIIFGACGSSVIGATLGIIGIVQGNKSRSYDKEGKAGFICSIVGTSISCAVVLLILLCFVSFTSIAHCMFLPMLFW
jgi:hypothetical protein